MVMGQTEIRIRDKEKAVVCFFIIYGNGKLHSREPRDEEHREKACVIDAVTGIGKSSKKEVLLWLCLHVKWLLWCRVKVLSDGGEGSKNMRQLGKNSGMYRESYYSRLNHLLYCTLHAMCEEYKRLKQSGKRERL